PGGLLALPARGRDLLRRGEQGPGAPAPAHARGHGGVKRGDPRPAGGTLRLGRDPGAPAGRALDARRRPRPLGAGESRRLPGALPARIAHAPGPRARPRPRAGAAAAEGVWHAAGGGRERRHRPHPLPAVGRPHPRRPGRPPGRDRPLPRPRGSPPPHGLAHHGERVRRRTLRGTVGGRGGVRLRAPEETLVAPAETLVIVAGPLLTEVNIWFRYSLHARSGRGERLAHPG